MEGERGSKIGEERGVGRALKVAEELQSSRRKEASPVIYK